VHRLQRLITESGPYTDRAKIKSLNRKNELLPKRLRAAQTLTRPKWGYVLKYDFEENIMPKKACLEIRLLMR